MCFVGGKFEAAMEKDVQLASRKFWQTVWWLRKENQSLAWAVFILRGE